jgi:putative transposase
VDDRECNSIGPRDDTALGRLMRWVGVTHVRRHQEHYHRRGAGHLYQGRYKAFPVAEDDYFLTLCRYVEANPVRAKLVERADQWRWGGFGRRLSGKSDLPLSEWPIGRPRNWATLIKGGLGPDELKTLRQCVARGRPLGSEAWIEATASRLGLTFTLRNPGRPRKYAENQ